MGVSSKAGSYGEDSIVDKGERLGLRDRPGTLLGNSDERGALHALMELVANGLDEGREGFTDSVSVIVREDNSISVIDHGRGVPMAWNEKAQKYNFKLVFCTLYASGKGKGSSYSSSEGLNGIGCTAANYTSDYMEVQAFRVDETDGKTYRYFMRFEDGIPVCELEKTEWDGHTGTTITFLPSDKVFSSIEIPFDMLVEKLRRKSVVMPGVRINLQYKDKEAMCFYYEDGMYEYVEKASENPINKDVLRLKQSRLCNDGKGAYDESKNYNGSCEIALSFSTESGFIDTYHNGAILSLGGVTKNALIDGVLKVFEKKAKEEDKLDKSGRLNKRDVEDMICAVIETRCEGEFSMYEHQTKEAISNPSLQKLTLDTVIEQIDNWGLLHKKEYEAILARILLNKDIREKADAVKKNVLKKLNSDPNKVTAKHDKFTDCETNNPDEAEIYYVEGDSAGGQLIRARNQKFQAIQKLRGKIPNCLKKTLEMIFSADSIIVQIIMLLGCGIEARSKFIEFPKFDISKLKYKKIIIATDADVDGAHITTLLLAMFYRLTPSLLKGGYVYIALSPLYVFTLNPETKNESHIYAYNDEERDHVIAKLESEGISKRSYRIQRSKGLGENEIELTKETLMNPRTRRLQQVSYPENEEELYSVFNSLLGTDIETRKQLIVEYFKSGSLVEY